jgi:hypothetical protein
MRVLDIIYPARGFFFFFFPSSVYNLVVGSFEMVEERK